MDRSQRRLGAIQTLCRALFPVLPIILVTGALSPTPHACAQALNDICATATPIAVGEIVPVDTAIATNEGNAASCFYTATGVGVADLWYSVTPATAGDYRVSTCAAGTDTQLAIYLSDCVLELACSDDACPGFASEIDFSAAAGETYLIEISGWGAATTVVTELTVTELTGPTHDTCDSALPIDLGVPVPFDTSLAADEGMAGSCFFTGSGAGVVDLWFSVTATASGAHVATTCGGGVDTQLAVYTDCASELACSDDGCPGFASSAEFDAVAGQTYLVQVSGWGPTATVASELTVVDLAAVAPPNDTCATALDAAIGETPFDTSFASASGVAPGCGMAVGSPDVWYRVTPPCDGVLTVSLEGSSFDTVLGVFDGCPASSGTLMACDDDTFGAQSAVALSVAAGEEYLVQVTGTAGASGPGLLAVDCRPADGEILALDWGSTAGALPAALAESGHSVFLARYDAEFEVALNATLWPLVIIENPSHLLAPSTVDALVDYVATPTGRAVLSYWDLDASASLQAAFGVASASEALDARPVLPAPGQSGHPIWAGPHGNLAELALAPGAGAWFDNGDDLTAAAGAAPLALFDIPATPTATLIANDERTIVHGWLADDMVEPDVITFIENEIAFFLGAPTSPAYVRGDANGDGQFDVSDPVATLDALFLPGGSPLPCADAADSNGDGAIDVADPVLSLAALFIPGSPSPPPPHPGCGVDAALGCASPPICP